ncbi:unnamed protein product [Nippostrongylus brasiliensis]|uniref:Reverse transcriptase domain-containing protein n=1 Tax=Nippostrongylus brasiliensis TaxID=27835 RepID=A0A0N4XFT6_NIPBR|nr:unnamed protein product [Nippostrongylus brasiliensis]
MKDSVWLSTDDIRSLVPKWPGSSSLTSYNVPVTSLQAVIDYIAGALEFFLNLSSTMFGVPTRNGKSTVTALLQSINHWSAAIDKGGSMDVIYLDFSRALDRVSHSKLILKRDIRKMHMLNVREVRARMQNRYRFTKEYKFAGATKTEDLPYGRKTRCSVWS